MTKKYATLIGGKWSEGENFIKVYDKFSGELIDVVPESSPADVEMAVTSAHNSFKIFRKYPAFKRAAILEKASLLIDRDKDEITKIICQEAGKSWKYASGEVSRSAETFKFAAEESKRIYGETIPIDASSTGENRFGYFTRVPLGVVAAITPFNFPLNLVSHKVAPAIASGNTIVLKPASYTPVSALKLGEILMESGLPSGVLNIVIGSGATVGNQLIRHPLCKKVTFTGSPSVGANIVKNAGVKKVTLELGNNSATIIEADADIELAAKKCVISSFANSGQVCISLQRIYAHQEIKDEFIDAMKRAADTLKVGDPLDKNTDMGPMINEDEAIRAEEWIHEAVKNGARIECGGIRKGNLLYPTILSNVENGMKVMCMEIFAPVVSICSYSNMEEAVKMVNDSEFGLQTGVYTKDIKKAFYAIEELDVGGVMVNDTSMFRVDHMPYGGNKLSGLGREGVKYAIEEMTNIKMVVFNLN